MFLISAIAWYAVCIISAALLFAGSAKSKKVLLIPWLVIVKVRIVCLFLLTLFIIFLEGRLYTIGSTVFGLLGIVCLMAASLEAYFWQEKLQLFKEPFKVQSRETDL